MLSGEVIFEALDDDLHIVCADIEMGHEPDFFPSADQDAAFFQIGLEGFEPGRLQGEEEHHTEQPEPVNQRVDDVDPDFCVPVLLFRRPQTRKKRSPSMPCAL